MKKQEENKYIFLVVFFPDNEDNLPENIQKKLLENGYNTWTEIIGTDGIYYTGFRKSLAKACPAEIYMNAEIEKEIFWLKNTFDMRIRIEKHSVEDLTRET